MLYHHGGDFNFSPLHLAAYQETKLSLIKFLISVRDRKLCRMTDCFDYTPLHVAILMSRIEEVKLLIEADPEQLSCGTTILPALKVSYGKTDDDISVKIRRLLLEKQPNACKIRTGEFRWTALHCIASEGDMSAVEDIIRFCPDSAHMVDNEGHDFLDIASAYGHSKKVKNLLQREDSHLMNIMSKREKELCVPLEYVVLYRELVNRFGEIIEPSKCLEEDTTPMYAALRRFLGHVSEMADVETGKVTKEKISEWEKMAEEYTALGLQVSWFQQFVARYSDWFAKRAEHVTHFVNDIVAKEAKIATKEEALKIKYSELHSLQNELNELNTEVDKLKEQCDAYSVDPLLEIQKLKK